MRKLKVISSIVAMMFGVVALSQAAVTSVTKSTYKASISFTGTGIVSVDMVMVSPGAGNSVAWSGVTAAQTEWKLADTYFIMYSTITQANGGVRLYTDNKANDAYVKYTGIESAAGLVGYDAAIPTASSTTLPMCWRVSDAVLAAGEKGIIETKRGDNSVYLSTQATNNYPCFLWMLDASTSTFNTSSSVVDYATVKDQSRGIQHAESTWGLTPSPDYIYLGAKFKDAVIPRTYSATIRVEAYYD